MDAFLGGLSSRGGVGIFGAGGGVAPEVICGSLLFVTMGGFFALIGAVLATKSIRLFQTGVRTRATVVELKTGADGEATPIVEFTDLSGTRQRARLSIVNGLPVGSEMDVIYDPHKPGSASGSSFSDLWMFPIMFVGVGGLVFLFGLLCLTGLVHTT